ncbi:MAG: ribonuclease E/G, partial [Gammaproteobacteria bacterium]|nr:ribonuclease E/G [Gammaproteobacteria bacterium]
TAAEGIHEKDLLADMKYLQGKWSNISDDATASGVPALIYQDLPVQLRVLRDLVCEDTREITVNHQVTHQLLALFLSEFAPNKQDCLVLAEEGAPLFEIYNIEDQIKAALARQVPLKSGGYLVFDQTEAMTTIDVNTGSFTGKRDLEDTIYQTNIEAATVIPRQLRLRGIGGIVIVDFIDMLDEEHRRQVLRILEKGQHNDRVNWKISGFSEIGLVEMTRKRSKDSLLRITCEPCSVCQGRGYLKSAETVCLEIYREMQRKSADFKKGRYMILASPTVIDYLLENSSVYIEKLSEKVGDIQLQVEMSYSQEEYDIVMMESPESLQVSES